MAAEEKYEFLKDPVWIAGYKKRVALNESRISDELRKKDARVVSLNKLLRKHTNPDLFLPGNTANTSIDDSMIAVILHIYSGIRLQNCDSLKANVLADLEGMIHARTREINDALLSGAALEIEELYTPFMRKPRIRNTEISHFDWKRGDSYFVPNFAIDILPEKYVWPLDCQDIFGYGKSKSYIDACTASPDERSPLLENPGQRKKNNPMHVVPSPLYLKGE